jgi:hypothetical protein
VVRFAAIPSWFIAIPSDSAAFLLVDVFVAA